MIRICCSQKFRSEKEYIFSVIFKEFLGLNYIVEYNEALNNIQLDINEKLLILAADFWNNSNDNYLTTQSLPKVEYGINKFAPEKDIPILYGSNKIQENENSIECSIDIFGGCFFTLSRMEETIIYDRDHHDRFAATSSVAYKYKYLDRPIVDEYVELLWNMISKLAPSVKRKKYTPTNFITCDVDYPNDPARTNLIRTIRKSLGDIIKRNSVVEAFHSWKNYFYHKFSINCPDPFLENLYWIMDTNEKAGNKVAFYFIPQNTSNLDNNVNYFNTQIIQLINDMIIRGHEIGIHPGYECYDNSENFQKSVLVMKNILKNCNVEQNNMGGRMHFLRWDIMKTPQLWEKNEMDYDSSLGFADKAGFRCGTSKEFTMFDLNTRSEMKLKQRPLITMDNTVMGEKYENCGHTDLAFNRFLYFKETCHKYNGTYTLLWHNNFFNHPNDKNIYKKLIK